jgi:hypothetical protein
MIDLRSGEATADWIAICDPALRSLRRAADKLDFVPLCEGLDRLSEALATAHASDSRTISGEAREPLLSRYEELVKLMPQAFALDLDRSARETIILQSLLMQVEGVRKVTIDRLYAAGLTTLEAMRLATAADLAKDRRALPRLPRAGQLHRRRRDARGRAAEAGAARGEAPRRAGRIRARFGVVEPERIRREAGAAEDTRADAARRSGAARTTRRGRAARRDRATSVRKESDAPRGVPGRGAHDVRETGSVSIFLVP